jgi:hypothetical protein
MSIIDPITESDSWHRNEAKVIRFTVTTDEVTVAGWTTVFALHRSADDDEVLFTEEGTVFDGPNKLIDVSITATDTENLPRRNYYFYFRRTDAGYEQVLSEGKAALL